MYPLQKLYAHAPTCSMCVHMGVGHEIPNQPFNVKLMCSLLCPHATHTQDTHTHSQLLLLKTLSHHSPPHHTILQPLSFSQKPRSTTGRGSSGGAFSKPPSAVPKIREALNFMRNHSFEVPFIANYRKEYVEPELDVHDLWTIWAE